MILEIAIGVAGVGIAAVALWVQVRQGRQSRSDSESPEGKQAESSLDSILRIVNENIELKEKILDLTKNLSLKSIDKSDYLAAELKATEEADVLFQKGVGAFAEAKYKEAAKYWQMSLKLQPTVAAMKNLSRLHYLFDENEVGLEIIEDAEKLLIEQGSQRDPELIRLRGLILDEIDKPEEALAAYRQAEAVITELSLEPDPYIYNNIGILLEMREGKYQEAIELYIKAINCLESTGRPVDPILYWNLGDAYLSLNNLGHAFVWFCKAESQYDKLSMPQDPGLHYSWSEYHLKKGDFELAADSLDICETITDQQGLPGDPFNTALRAEIELEKGNPDRARILIEEAKGLHSKRRLRPYPWLLVIEGRISAALGEALTALKLFDRAEQEFKDRKLFLDPDSILHRVDVLIMLGDYISAKKLFARVSQQMIEIGMSESSHVSKLREKLKPI